MLKLKLQCFGHQTWRADSLDKTMVLEKIEVGREGDNRRWDDWMVSLTQWTTETQWTLNHLQLQKMVKNREIQHAAVHGVTRSHTWLSDWVTKTNSVTGFPGGSDVKSACSAGDHGSIHGSGSSPGEGHGYPHQYSCLENSMDRGAWQATVYGVAKSQTWLNQQHFHSVIRLPRWCEW